MHRSCVYLFFFVGSAVGVGANDDRAVLVLGKNKTAQSGVAWGSKESCFRYIYLLAGLV